MLYRCLAIDTNTGVITKEILDKLAQKLKKLEILL